MVPNSAAPVARSESPPSHEKYTYDEKPLPRIPIRRFSTEDTLCPESPGAPEIQGAVRPQTVTQIIGGRAINFVTITQFFTEWWAWELVSLAMSAFCMGAIVVLLVVHNGQSIPTLPFGITLNAAVSILARVGGAAMLLATAEAMGQLKWNWYKKNSKKLVDFEMFDSASRGLWGSSWLLFKMKGKILPTLGAIITLLSIAIEPAFQYILTSHEIPVFQGNGTVARAFRYQPIDSTVSLVDGVMQAAVSPLWSRDQITTRERVSCPTGNCRYEFDSLAVCSACEDIFAELSFGCFDTGLEWYRKGPLEDSSTAPSRTACGYWLNATSAEPSLVSGYVVQPNTTTPGEALQGRIFSMYNYTHESYFYYNGSLRFKDAPDPLIDFMVFSLPDSASVYANKTPAAHECMLRFCGRSYTSSMIDGIYEETVTETYFDNRTNAGGWLPRAELEEDVQVLTRYYDRLLSIDNPARNTSFEVGNISFIIATTPFDEFMPGWVTVENSSSRPQLIHQWWQGISKEEDLKNSPWMLPNNVTKFVEKIEKAMTNVIRSDPVNMKLVQGPAWAFQTVVFIRWQWITLPATLLLASFAFLVAVILQTDKQKDHVGIWKNAALATLLHCFQGDVRKAMGEGWRMGDATARASRLDVKFSPDHGWLISHESSPETLPNTSRRLSQIFKEPASMTSSAMEVSDHSLTHSVTNGASIVTSILNFMVWLLSA
ncbi:hypothetical protein P152DRAFT_510850 [Eremomyces bilateralis CBS 781.70]|uniref:Uncharacterized protein n=1 Tax=Eremomyces bilateralis CBS 781.70 TaxID=1392243 RepID=A0A6G1GIH9_9PEZI|nr:uncharacterized protein P152DRAFT_510850 [Eremomyces bilateralis CBS 781.70]KAF1817670.1 hypothetical protein P152DRAFT_510850 [Eremomyces bilateralis CBS 781.70]